MHHTVLGGMKLQPLPWLQQPWPPGLPDPHRPPTASLPNRQLPNRRSCDRKINEFVKRVRAFKIHILLIGHLRKQVRFVATSP